MMKFFFFIFFFLILRIASFPQANQNAEVNNKIIPPANTYAVVIGITKYEDDNIPGLNFSNKDAEVFAEYLQSKAGGVIPPDNIRLLLDSKATTAAIYNALKWLKERCVLDKDENNNTGNLIYFYFSGHGDMEVETLKELGFLLSFNTPSNNYINNAVRLEDLNYYANTLSVNFNARVVIITDACHSGKLAGSDNRGSYLVGKELSTVKANEVRITSCAPEEVSNENEKWGGGRGVFSYYFINGLKGDADKNHDSTVTLNEIKDYIDRKISTDPVIKEYNLKQTPVLKGADNFRLSVVDTGELLLLQRSLAYSMPVQSDQEYFFSLLKERDKLESIDFAKLNKLPQEKIPASFIREVAAISDSDINIKRIEQLVKSILNDKEESKLFKENLVEALHTSGQKIINLYLSGDAAELERRRYYNSKSSGYDIYPKMYSLALKLTEPDNPFYQILKVNQYYFSGVAARLKIPTVEEPKQKLLLEEALAAQKMALELEKNAAYIHNELGILYKAKKDFTVAENYFKNATILAPGWAIPYSNLCGLYGETKKYEDALKAGEKAESLQAGLHITNSNIGVAYELSANLLFAEEFYRNAIDINSRHYFPFERLGYVYMNTTQYALADSFYYEAELRKKGYHFKENESDIGTWGIVTPPMPQFFCTIDTLILQKDDILAFFTWGVQEYREKKYKNAERILKKVIALDKTNPLVFHYMGKIFYDQQKWEEAEIMFKFAVTCYLDDSAFYKYCDSVINSKKYPYDHECFERFFKISYYQMIEDYYFLATLYESWAHYEEAEIWCRKIIDLDKNDLEGYVKLWRMLEKLGRYTETEKVIQSYSGYEKERTERELNEFYRRTILKFPENGDWPYRLGLLLYDRAETKSRTAYLDTIIWFPKLNREIFIDMDSYERLSTDLKWDKTISGSPQLVTVEPQLHENPAGIRIPGTGELITLADAIYTPRKDAITYLLKADSLLTETETKADINFKVGNVFVWTGSKKQAYPYYTESVKLGPGNANARLSLIDVCKALYKNRAGLEQLDYLYDHQQINFPKRLLFAEFSIHSSQFEKAKKIIEEAQAIHPYVVPETFDLLGRMNLLAHQPKLALPFYKTYFDTDKKNYSTIYTIARLYAQSGNKREAIKWLESAIQKGFNFLYVIKADAAWIELKKTPEWNSLIKRIKPKKYLNRSEF